MKRSFDLSNNYYTHTIAYAIRGVLECGINDNNDEWILSAKKSFEAISDLILDNGFLSARIDNAANPLSDYVCLVGNCQMSIIGCKLYEIFGSKNFLGKSQILLNYVKSKQIVSEDSNTNGGIPGSWPLSGHYNSFRLPNWSAKFFIDAMLISEFLD